MAYGLQTSGGSWWDTNSSYDTPVYPETVVRDIATQGQAVQTASSNDGWTDFFKTTVSQVFDYALKKDAVLTGAEVQKTLQTPVYQPVPIYSQAAQAQQIVPGISNMLLLIGAAVGVYLVTQK